MNKYEKCWQCNRTIKKSKAYSLEARHYCDKMCFQKYMEEKERKAGAYEDIRIELGFNEKIPVNKVIEAVNDLKSELTMRKEGFK